MQQPPGTQLRGRKKVKYRSKSTFMRVAEPHGVTDDSLDTLDGNEHLIDKDKERNRNVLIFQEESAKNDNWTRKYIHSTMFLLGYGSYGSVFQVTTRLYTQIRQRAARDRYLYHSDFLANYASQLRMKPDQYDKLRDKNRYERMFDTVAMKYEILEQSYLEDGITRFCLFLRREFLVLDTMWRRYQRLLIGFPIVFEFGYIGDKQQYGVNSKYKNTTFTYLNLQGEEVKFFADTHNRNLLNVTKISYMAMELLGPSVEDYRRYFEPWYEKTDVRPFFQVRTTFRLVDQVLCRLYMMHKAGFVHHDLKPDNLALGHGQAMNTVYLIDFGFAKQVAENRVEDWMGSRKYISVDAYSGEPSNFAQDIESWFYLTMALLYDSLPWSDDVIDTMLDSTDEAGRWQLAASIKHTWWGDYDKAVTLKSLIEQVESLHKREVPDIGSILIQLHRRVRDLRGHLRQIRDPNAAVAELANNKSKGSMGYLNIRKVLLQIFDLPNFASGRTLGDKEFRSFQDARREQGLVPFPWFPYDFEWEWDCNHQRMVSGGIGEMVNSTVTKINKDLLVGNNHRTTIRSQIDSMPAYSQLKTLGKQGRRFHILSDNNTDSRERADEISYAFNSRNNTLMPKWPSGDARQCGPAQRRRALSAMNR